MHGLNIRRIAARVASCPRRVIDEWGGLRPRVARREESNGRSPYSGRRPFVPRAGCQSVQFSFNRQVDGACHALDVRTPAWSVGRGIVICGLSVACHVIDSVVCTLLTHPSLHSELQRSLFRHSLRVVDRIAFDFVSFGVRFPGSVVSVGRFYS